MDTAARSGVAPTQTIAITLLPHSGLLSLLGVTHGRPAAADLEGDFRHREEVPPAKFFGRVEE